jgi:hypothetical protein
LGVFQPIESAMDCDLAATWRLLHMGGAYHNKLYGCHLCDERCDWVGGHHGERCEDWCLKVHPLDENFECHHQKMLHEVNVYEMSIKLQHLLEALRDLQTGIPELHETSILDCEQDSRGLTNPDFLLSINSIHFDISNPELTAVQLDDYADNLRHNLAIRGLSVVGSISELQQQLQQSMITCRIRDAIAYYEKNQDKRVLNLIECAPCLLHMENRCGLKVLSMVLTEGMNNASGRLSYSNIGNQKERLRKFVKDVETIANKTVLGTDDYPAAWQRGLPASLWTTTEPESL